MDENEILDDFPNEDHQILPTELIQTVIECAKYAKIFVFVSIAYDVFRFAMNIYVMYEHQSSISDIYGSFSFYGLQSLVVALVSLISVYFLWQFSKKGVEMEIDGDQAFIGVLTSLKHYFIASLVIIVLFKILQYLGPFLGQFIVF